MKTTITALAATALLTFAACNNPSNNHQDHAAGDSNAATEHASSDDATPAPTVKPAFTNVDAEAAVVLNEIVDYYLQIKNALAGDDAAKAAGLSATLAASFNKLDKSLLTAEQKKLFDEAEKGLKEQAENINKSSADIKLQRQNFSAMSEKVYALSKSFGGGRTLYQDFCPMYNDNKGGMWLSEVKEIKNPYFGSQMLACGSIQQIIE